jgi:hypothetical protein
VCAKPPIDSRQREDLVASSSYAGRARTAAVRVLNLWMKAKTFPNWSTGDGPVQRVTDRRRARISGPAAEGGPQHKCIRKAYTAQFGKLSE